MREITDPVYQQTLDIIYSFVENSRLRQAENVLPEKNLTRMKDLLFRLGDPHLCYPVIHIAGTKGKGSTAAMLANILVCAGYKVGLYTSPHLQDFCERIQVDNQPIPHTDLSRLVSTLLPFFQNYDKLSTFEITTALGFQYFREQAVDIAVVEVGLGGRLDATNVVEPLVSVITSISLDHVELLGDTVEKVAAEKGGIIKALRPVVVAKQQAGVYSVLEKIAEKQEAVFIKAESKIIIEMVSMNHNQLEFQVMNREFQKPLKLGLLGEYQIENVQSVLSVVEILQGMKWKIKPVDVEVGLLTVKWPARFEILCESPKIIIDSSHNPYSAGKLIESVRKYFPEKKIDILFGASRGKDVEGMLQNLLPVCERVVFSQSIHPRSTNPEELVKLAIEMGYESKAILPVEDALALCVEQWNEERLILVTGSVFIAAAVRNIWNGLNRL